jgi:hypothetical protein
VKPGKAGRRGGLPSPALFIALFLIAASLPGASPVSAGHELPFYPSYYPQEIRLETVELAAAAPKLEKAALHAYLGGDPFARRKVPANVTARDSLGGYVALTFNQASPIAATRESRCEAARQVGRSLAAVPGAFVFHPYPVTPYHGDYLAQFDLAQAQKKAYEARGAAAKAPVLKLRARGALAERLVKLPARANGQGWDAAVEDVDLSGLLSGRSAALGGWQEPPWVKEGWYHAYLLESGAVGEPAARQAVEALYRRLATGAYASAAERVGLERQLVSKVTAGCERVVLGYALRREYFNSEFSDGVENVAWDSQAGFDSAIFVRTVKLKDFPWNGWLRLGIGSKPAAAWNPVAGFTDPAGRLLWAAVGDPALIPGPYASGWVANRALPAPVSQPAPAEVELPGDALIPEPGTGMLGAAGKGRTARTRISYRIIASAFHDNTRMTPADVLYAYSFAYRWGAKSAGGGMDPAVEAATALMRQELVGLRVVRVDSDVKKFAEMTFTYVIPIIDVYVNGGDLGPAELAALAPPWSPIPWHVLALMDEAARRGIAAFSAAEATRRGVPWLDLARDSKTKDALAGLVDGFAAQAWIPPELKGIVMADEAQTRWTALKNFYAKRGHFLVTNGPYSLEKWSDKETVLRVFRDFTNPNGVGTFDRFAIPRRAYVMRVSARGDRLTVTADVERVERFLRDYRVVREPLAKPATDEDRAEAPECRYVVVGADGSVAAAGASREMEGGQLVVNLKGRLKPGAYTAMIALRLGENDVDPEISVTQFRVEPAP